MDIQDLMVKTVAAHVNQVLDAAMRARCNGCKIDHPSQMQHDCVMIEDKATRVFLALNEALEMLDWKDVQEDFFDELSVSQLLRCCPCFEATTWWSDLFRRDLRDDLISCVLGVEEQ